jgi:serine/threonine-protein kinase
MSVGASFDRGACPDPGQLVELARGALEPGERDALLAHAKACPDCGEVIRLWTAADGGSSSTGADPAARRPPSAGEILAGKYRVERVLGIGGMGMVLAATHLQLERHVALKLMLRETAGSPETAERFVQEARAAAEIQSEHVVRVLDVGSLDDGAPYLVMEFLRGSDLARVLRARGPLPVVDVAGYLLQACEALAEAHALGIVHRDLKPANLFLTARADGSPLVKVLDFGVSKLTRRRPSAGATLTKSRSILGTPLYMSPEQLRDTRSVGPATDIWSLGCILYELLAGAPPFVAETAEALGALVATGPCPRVRDVRPDAPRELADAIVRCLEKDPAARFASLGDLARLLGSFAPADTAPIVGRVERIAAGVDRSPGAHPEDTLPFADTVHSGSPPRLAGTGAALARSGSSSPRPQPTTRAFWIAGAAVAVVLSVVTLSRGRWVREAAPSPAASSPPQAPPAEASRLPPPVQPPLVAGSESAPRSPPSSDLARSPANPAPKRSPGKPPPGGHAPAASSAMVPPPVPPPSPAKDRDAID